MHKSLKMISFGIQYLLLCILAFQTFQQSLYTPAARLGLSIAVLVYGLVRSGIRTWLKIKTTPTFWSVLCTSLVIAASVLAVFEAIGKNEFWILMNGSLICFIAAEIRILTQKVPDPVTSPFSSVSGSKKLDG